VETTTAMMKSSFVKNFRLIFWRAGQLVNITKSSSYLCLGALAFKVVLFKIVFIFA